MLVVKPVVVVDNKLYEDTQNHGIKVDLDEGQNEGNDSSRGQVQPPKSVKNIQQIIMILKRSCNSILRI